MLPTIVVLTIIFLKWNSSRRTIEQMEVEKECVGNMQHKFEKLLNGVRIRQHEFKNHITAIFAAHYTYKTYEQLVKAQEEYCRKLQNENKYNNLLFIENNLLAGFLYEKFLEIEAEKIKVEYKVSGNLKNTVMPTYYLIEIIGILINNAIEACVSAETEEIYIEVCEDETISYFIIRNKYKHVSYSEIEQRIRELREVQNYTREAFAEKVDISSKFLYEIETGKKGFSADTLSRISVALSVSCDYIMFGEETGHHTSERIMCVLETMKPAQVCQIQNILQILYEMCDSR